MALRPDRNYTNGTDISFFMNEIATRGVIVVFDVTASGSGAAMDDANAVVKLPDNANGSGEPPAGLLVNDVVNKDLTQTHLNQHKDEIQLGGKVTVLRRGTVVTSSIATGQNPSAGKYAYFTTDGDLMACVTAALIPAGATQVGQWLSKVDNDGFAKVEINIT